MFLSPRINNGVHAMSGPTTMDVPPIILDQNSREDNPTERTTLKHDRPANDGSQNQNEHQNQRQAKPRRLRKGYMGTPNIESLERMDPKDAYEKLKTNSKNEDYEFLKSERNLWGWGGSGSTTVDEEVYENSNFAENAVSYDYWAQAYRMLGGYIDCDHPKGRGGSQSGSGDGEEWGTAACSRWMVWASYVDPYYSGGGYYEYHGNDYDDGYNRKMYEDYEEDESFVGNLNCHERNTHWILMGIYRQEFYQYIEQISKHLWAIDAYEYITTCAALDYMTDDDCFKVGTSDQGETIYAGVQPLSGGDFQMRLYLDAQCLYPKDSVLGKTYDDYASATNMKDDIANDDYAYTYWTEAQEYTLTNVNNVFDTYRQCTLCMDYPTYQDGYLIGDTGMDEGDIINQCWKFHSHDSFPCDSSCLELAHQQGSIKYVEYNGQIFGGQSSERASTMESASSSSGTVSSVDKLKADVFLTFSSILFVACFLAYTVSRSANSRKKRKGSRSKSRSRKLLDDDTAKKSRKSSSGRSKSERSSSKKKEKDSESDLVRKHRHERLQKIRSSRTEDTKESRRHRSQGRDSYEPPSGDYSSPELDRKLSRQRSSKDRSLRESKSRSRSKKSKNLPEIS